MKNETEIVNVLDLSLIDNEFVIAMLNLILEHRKLKDDTSQN